MPNIEMGFLSSLKNISFPASGIIVLEMHGGALGSLTSIYIREWSSNIPLSIGGGVILANSGTQFLGVREGASVNNWGGVVGNKFDTVSHGLINGRPGIGGPNTQNFSKGLEVYQNGACWSQYWPVYFDDIHYAGLAFFNLNVLTNTFSATLVAESAGALSVAITATLYKPAPTSFTLNTSNTLPPYAVPIGGTKVANAIFTYGGSASPLVLNLATKTGPKGPTLSLVQAA